MTRLRRLSRRLARALLCVPALLPAGAACASETTVTRSSIGIAAAAAAQEPRGEPPGGQAQAPPRRPARGQQRPEPPAAEGQVDVRAINRPFRNLKDVQEFVAKFERESREIFVQRVAIADAVRLQPGDRVADVGTGTGLFMAPFALRVGPAGRVICEDIAPLFLEHVRRRALAGGWANVETVLGDDRSIGLPPGSVDVVFVCDTYHHFEEPEAMLASIRAALVPGGRLVVIDFHRIPGRSSDWVLGHVRAGEATVRAEIEAAGFVQVRREAFLAENWFLEFRRP